MAHHDDYARRTPYELALPDDAFAREAFSAIREEARARGASPSDPSTFVHLEAAARALAELRPPGEGAEGTETHAWLLYHAYHLDAADRPVYLLDALALRYLVEAASPGAWTPRAPDPAGYLQLPQHMVWARTGGGETPESVDGLFWTVDEAGLVHGLAVTGVRGDREGFSAVPLPAAPLADARAWLEPGMRDEGQGADFASTLPGAELSGLLEVRTAGELLRILGLAFWYLDTVADAAGPPVGPAQGRAPGDEPPRDVASADTPSADTPSADTPSGDTQSADTQSGDTQSADTPSRSAPSGHEPAGGGPPPTRLPWRRVTLAGGA